MSYFCCTPPHSVLASRETRRWEQYATQATQHRQVTFRDTVQYWWHQHSPCCYHLVYNLHIPCLCSLNLIVVYAHVVRLCLWAVATNRPLVYAPDDIWIWRAMVELLTGKKRELGEKHVPMVLCRPQIPRGMTRVKPWASTVRGGRLTAWAMAQPSVGYTVIIWLTFCEFAILVARLGLSAELHLTALYATLDHPGWMKKVTCSFMSMYSLMHAISVVI